MHTDRRNQDAAPAVTCQSQLRAAAATLCCPAALAAGGRIRSSPDCFQGGSSAASLFPARCFSQLLPRFVRCRLERLGAVSPCRVVCKAHLSWLAGSQRSSLPLVVLHLHLQALCICFLWLAATATAVYRHQLLGIPHACFCMVPGLSAVGYRAKRLRATISEARQLRQDFASLMQSETKTVIF